MPNSHSRIQKIGDQDGNPVWYEGETPFTYICSATSAPEVNLDPLLALGLNRLDRVILLIGASTVPTPVDIRNAIEPAGRLKSLINDKRAASQLPPVSVIEVRCPPDGADAWHERIAITMRQTSSELLLLNLQGGTRAMIFSAFAALQEVATPDGDKQGLAFIFHSKPSRIEEIWPKIGGRSIALPGGQRVLAEDILRARGFTERLREENRQRAIAAIKRKHFTDTVFSLIIGDDNPAAIRIRAGAMHGTVMPWLPEARSLHPTEPLHLVEQQLRGDPQFWNELQAVAAESDGLLDQEHGMTALGGGLAVSYFGGGWFEEWAYLRALEALGHLPSWDILMGVHFSFDDNGKIEDGEIDLLIAGQGTSFLVECKAGAREEKLGRDAVRKISGWRDRLAGAQGGAVFLCLNKPKKQEILRPMSREAESSGIPLWFSTEGISAYKGWLKELAQIS